MKLCLGNTPVKSLNIRKLDVDTNDATIVASDMQSGSIAYAKGQKVTGTGKAFAFASYGAVHLNVPIPVPSMINIVEIASTIYPTTMPLGLADVKDVDLSTSNVIANVSIDGQTYPVSAIVTDGMLSLTCEKDISLEVFYGKDDHV